MTNKLIGHDDIFFKLKDLYDTNKFPNKILLSGPDGIGKNLISKHLLNYILSKDEDLPTSEVVHAHGTITVRDDERFVRGIVARLTRRHEAAEPRPWKMGDSAPEFIDGLLGHIVGIEIAAWWRVVDDGHGIDPSVKHRLFEPFTTTKPAGEGTGLGLSLAYQIINEHQGKIEVASPPPGKPRGTAITLWLPLYQQDDHLPHAQDTDC